MYTEEHICISVQSVITGSGKLYQS